jgi:hypothetical protein
MMVNMKYMSYFSKVYYNIRKELLSEQEEEQINTDMEQEPLQSDQEEPTISNDESSEIKNIEEDSIKVDWIKKIIKLLTLLNREDETVDKILSDLSSGEVNANSLKEKQNLIEELIRSIPIEKNI